MYSFSRRWPLSSSALISSLTVFQASVMMAQFAVPELDSPVAVSQNPVLISQLATGNAQAPDSVPKKSERLAISSPGPWGQISSYPIFLEAPSFLIDRFPLPNSRPRWAFPTSRVEELEDLFKVAELDPELRQVVLTPTAMVTEGEWTYLFPPLPMLEAMTSLQREIVYAELRKYQVNEYHFEPVLITSGDADEWFHSSQLRPELIAKIKGFVYRRGDALAISDLPALMNYVNGEAEGREMLKAFTRTRSLIARLIVNEKSDISAIINYWTTGLNLRRKDVEPLLQSVLNTEGIDSIDVVHMLPALPRKLLLTYPDMGLAKDGIFPDCHWTSLNFFNYNPQGYLLDSRLATTAVLERFNAVEPPYKFGDILFFLDSKNGDAFHSCVYVADDIVFTKNGRNVLSPWILSRLDDVKKVYLFDNNGRVQGFRNKQAPTLPSN